MNTIYGNMPDKALDQYKNQLHKEVHRLLLYKDPKMEDSFYNVDYDKYFIFLMKKLTALSEILANNSVLLSVLSTLQAAYNETLIEDFSFSDYKKLIFDTQSLIELL